VWHDESGKTQMVYFDQSTFEIRCEWGLPGVDHLARGQTVVIVDVLSFTTCIDIALSRGVTVFPYASKDDTVEAYAAQRDAVVAGARDRLDQTYSLSPASLLNAPSGLRLVLPSPNGSAIAFAARSSSMHVVAGSLRNASAVAAWAQGRGTPITVIPAGEQWPNGSLRPAVEDLIGAGAIVSRLSGSRSSEAEVASAAFEGVAESLLEQISFCASGRELIDRGFERDVELACALNVSRIVPVLEGGAFVDINKST
jgi:2-phosphosulfolactate phosphatase